MYKQISENEFNELLNSYEQGGTYQKKKTMDFSEYTLVSFGDSFTFGQDTVPIYDRQGDVRPAQKKYKSDCNKNSYTQFISDSLGFKNSINFGYMGSSNEKQLMLLEQFLHSNSKSKIFVLFNFTHTHRYVQFLKVNNERRYQIVDITPQQKFTKNYFTGIDSKSLDHNYTFFRNSVQDVYNHVKDRRMLYYMLSNYNVPYVTFDILNDMDSRILRDNPLKYIDRFDISPASTDEESLNFLKLYHQELVDKSPLLNHLGLHLLREFPYNNVNNIASWLIGKAKNVKNNAKYYMAERGQHWNIEGHREVGKLIEDFIKKKYKN